MRLYIAYKFTKVADKNRVVSNLRLLDKSLGSHFEVFILIKNYYSWNMEHKALHKSLIQMIKEIYKSDVMLFLIDGGEVSRGMQVEELIGSFFMKKKVYLVSDGSLLKAKHNRFEFESTNLVKALPPVIDLLTSFNQTQK